MSETGKWYLRGQMWTYEHILESQYWKDLPDKIDKAQLEQALNDAWDTEKRYAESQGYRIFFGGSPRNPEAVDVFCDRAQEED